jgi:hypothetical protein
LWHPYNEQLQATLTTVAGTPTSSIVYTTKELLPAFQSANAVKSAILRRCRVTIMPADVAYIPLGIQLSYFANGSEVSIPMTHVKMNNKTTMSSYSFRLPRNIAESRQSNSGDKILAIKAANSAPTPSATTLYYTIDCIWDLAIDSINVV